MRNLALLVATLLLFGAAMAASAQQQGSIGMDEIDASLSRDSGDWSDADRAQNEAMMRINGNTRTMSEQLSDLQRRIEALEAAQQE
jgi:TolA-binding protein